LPIKDEEAAASLKSAEGAEGPISSAALRAADQREAREDRMLAGKFLTRASSKLKDLKTKVAAQDAQIAEGVSENKAKVELRDATREATTKERAARAAALLQAQAQKQKNLIHLQQQQEIARQNQLKNDIKSVENNGKTRRAQVEALFAGKVRARKDQERAYRAGEAQERADVIQAAVALRTGKEKLYEAEQEQKKAIQLTHTEKLDQLGRQRNNAVATAAEEKAEFLRQLKPSALGDSASAEATKTTKSVKNRADAQAQAEEQRKVKAAMVAHAAAIKAANTAERSALNKNRLDTMARLRNANIKYSQDKADAKSIAKAFKEKAAAKAQNTISSLKAKFVKDSAAAKRSLDTAYKRNAKGFQGDVARARAELARADKSALADYNKKAQLALTEKEAVYRPAYVKANTILEQAAVQKHREWGKIAVSPDLKVGP